MREDIEDDGSLDPHYREMLKVSYHFAIQLLYHLNVCALVVPRCP